MIDTFDELEDLFGLENIEIQDGVLDDILEPNEPVEGAEPVKKEPAPIVNTIVPEGEDDFINRSKGLLGDEATLEETAVSEDDIHAAFEAVAKGLNKFGEFPELPQGAKFTEEKFLELYKEFNKTNALSEIETIVTTRHGEEGLRVFEDIYIKGAPIKEYLAKYQEEKNIEAIDIEDNIFNQKTIVREYLSGLEWTDGDIEDNIETLETSEKLAAMAAKYKVKLVERQRVERAQIAKDNEQRVIANKQAKEKRIGDLTKTVNDAIKEGKINGIPLSVEDNKSLLSYITEDAYRLPNGIPITEFDKDYIELKKDPVKFAALAKLVKDGLNVEPIKNSAGDDLNKKAFEFKANKKPVTKTNLGFLDLL